MLRTKRIYLLFILIAFMASPVFAQKTSFFKSMGGYCSDFFTTKIGLNKNKNLYKKAQEQNWQEKLTDIDLKLTQTMRSEQFEPSYRLKSALYLADNSADPSLVKEASESIGLIINDPKNSHMRAFLNDIYNDSLTFLNSREMLDISTSNTLSDFFALSLKKLFNKRVTIDYNEVLNENVFNILVDYRDGAKKLNEKLKNLKSLNSDDKILAAKIAKPLSSFMIKGQYHKKRLELVAVLGDLENATVAQIDELNSFLNTFHEKLDAYLVRANQDLGEIAVTLKPDDTLRSIIRNWKSGHSTTIEVFDLTRQWLQRKLEKPKKYSPIYWVYRKTHEFMDLVNKLIFGKVDDQYASGKSVFAGNDGITAYIKNLLIEDKLLRKMAVDFYLEIESHFPKLKSHEYDDPWSFWEKSPVNVLKIAEDITVKYLGEVSPIHAVRMINVFGHNDFVEYFQIYQRDLESFSELEAKDIRDDFEILNLMRPSRHSVLYAPEAIEGLNLPADYLDSMTELKEKLLGFIRDEKLDAKLKESLILYNEDFMLSKVFRSGYYHFYGGFYFASEFSMSNLSQIGPFNISNISSYLSGWYYKKIAMEATYLSGDAKILYFKGGYQKRVKLSDQKKLELLNKVNSSLKDENEPWDLVRLDLALLMVDINILHLEITSFQHGRGSAFAYKLFKK